MHEKKQYNGKIRVLKRLENLIQPLKPEELSGLEQSLIDEGGAYNPLWLWGDILVDGHHRYKLCRKHNLPFEVKQVYQAADTIEEVEYRIKREAIYQRNLDPIVQARYRSEMVEYQKSLGKTKSEAVAIVAKESKVSERQVYRDLEKTELINHLAADVKSKAESLSASQLKQLASLPKSKQKQVVQAAEKTGKKLADVIARPEPDPKEEAKRAKNLAYQYRDKLARAICDYHIHVPNRRKCDELVKIVQSVELWG